MKNKIHLYLTTLMVYVIIVALLSGCATHKAVVSEAKYTGQQETLEPTFVPTSVVKPAPTAVEQFVVLAVNTTFGIWTVKPHDTLWAISGKVYGVPWQWPKIYKQNRDKIKNPHWIYPKQKFVYKLKGA